MKKILLFSFLAGILFLNTYSQEQNPKITLKLDARADFDYKTFEGENASGFGGKFFNIIANGHINDKFSYNYRQRFTMNAVDNFQMAGRENKSNFHSIDWAYLNYKINDAFSVSAGKQVVMIGGWEYDYAPIDQYFWSDFWNNVYCYEVGIMANYTTPNKRHNIGFQISNSPFSTKTLSNMYAYNLIWYGDMDWFKTIYSVNLIEVKNGHYINYIALGNQFTFDCFTFQLDYMNRYASKHKGFFSDFNVVGNLAYNIDNKLNIFVKGGYDQNKAQQENTQDFIYDKCVLPGMEYLYYGVGAEYFPLKNSKDVRLHAYWYSNNKDPQTQYFNIGLRWQMKVLER